MTPMQAVGGVTDRSEAKVAEDGRNLRAFSSSWPMSLTILLLL